MPTRSSPPESVRTYSGPELPREIAGRLPLEAAEPTVETMSHSPAADGRTVSHEAIYRWIYALPKGELAANGILLQPKRTSRKRRKPLCVRTGGRIVGMTCIDARPEEASDRRVPGAWEGDVVIGRAGGKKATGLADVLIDRVRELPALMRGSLTWDQGTETAHHAQLTIATVLPVDFAHPHSPWERGTNENTNGLLREYLPKGTDITSHQPYLDAIGDGINDRPRACLSNYTPRETFTRLLNSDVASTN